MKTLKISSFKTYIVGVPPPYKGGVNWVFIKLTTNEGVEGWGECSAPTRREKSLVTYIEELCEQFIVNKVDPFNIEKLWKTLYEGIGDSHHFRHPGTFASQANAVIEMACWDIMGKVLNQPIYNLIGGKYNDKVRAYTYLHFQWTPGDPPEKAGEAAIKYVEQGFTAIKLDPITPFSPQPREVSLDELRYSENVIKNIRNAVGSKCDIIIGTHGQFTTHSAIRFIKRLEQYDPLWFEEPVPLENVDEMARIANHTNVPIATGERLATKWEFYPLLKKQAAQIIQVNLGLNGILEAKKIAGMAEAHFAQIAPWMYCGPVAAAANIQLDVCSPNFLIQEGIEKMDGFHAEILKEPIKWEKGYFIPPTGPGLGIEPDEKALAKYPPHSWEHPPSSWF